MWPFTGTQTQSNTCKVTPQITALSYLMCDLENVSQRYFRMTCARSQVRLKSQLVCTELSNV